MELTATRHAPDDAALALILDLLRRGFAGMEGRIDPPSSLHRLTLADLQDHCRGGEVWSLGPPPVACVILTPKADALYVGKLCVEPGAQGKGLARRLIDIAAGRARARGLPALELQTRVELTENHAAFARLGFEQAGSTAHRGYGRPTSLTFRKLLG